MRGGEAQDHSGLNDVLVSAITQLLDIEKAKVQESHDSTFVDLGGDSVAALQLTFELDGEGLSLDLETVLDKDNTIGRLSQILSSQSGLEEIETGHEPDGDASPGDGHVLGYLPTDVQQHIVDVASKQIGCAKDDIEDVLPLTSQQKLLWLGSLRQDGAYIARWCFSLSDIEVSRFRAAWLQVFHDTPILRSRFITGPDNTIYQAILRSSLDSDTSPGVVADYGRPLVAYSIVDSASGPQFHLQVHHALYDRWSIRLIFHDIVKRYAGPEQQYKPRPSFHPLLAPISDEEQASLTKRWKGYLGKTALTAVPDLKESNVSERTNQTLEMSVTLPSSTATKAELVTAAWSWVCSKQANSTDISFGLTTWGRDLGLYGVSEMAFPTFHTLPLCLRLDGGESVGDLLSKTKSSLWNLREIQRFGVDQISRISDASRQACQFNSVVVVQSDSFPHPASSPFDAKHLETFELKQGHQLVLECTPSKSNMKVSLSFETNFLHPSLAEPLLAHFCMVLGAFAAETSSTPCREIDFFGDSDERQIRQWTRPCEEKRTEPIFSMIEDQATVSPQSEAIWTTESTTSYGQLMERARRVAQMLQQRGTRQHIGVCFEKSALAIIAQLGVSLAGCTFIPMEPTNPLPRLEQIANNSDMSLLLCSQQTASKFDTFSVPSLVLTEDCLSKPDASPPTGRKNTIRGTDTAYIVYTSGSTGTPKGVMIQHEQISTSLKAQQKFFNISPSTRTLQFSSLAFDMSVHEIYMTLSAGGTVCIPTEAERFELEDFLGRAKTNYSMLTPSVAATLSKQSLAQISEISLCGEAISKGLVERVLDAGSQPWIVYGPTETTVVDLGHKAYASTSRFNLGYSFAATAWIVDADDPNRMAPVGMPGELAFSGHTLAAGYYKDAEKTDAAFRRGLKWTQRFPEHPLQRIYLTGDLATYNTDGTIQFLGRRGGYTKIMGNRVDLDEIRHVLRSESALHEVSVQICSLKGQNGTQRDMLLCFFRDPRSEATDTDDCQLISHTAETRSKAGAARDMLQRTLPSYMTPSAFIAINKLPLNTSGKLDAGSLLRLVEDLSIEELLSTCGEVQQESKVTSTVTHEQDVLREAWASVLSVASSSLSGSSHFIRTGGDSLRAMELAASVRNAGFSLPVRDIFERPVLEDMAKSLQKEKPDDSITSVFTHAEHEELVNVAQRTLELPKDSVESVIPCSSLQVQMLVASKQSPGAFVHRDCFELQSNVSHDEVEQVLRTMVQRNELLRTRIFIEPDTGRFLQTVITADAAFELHLQALDQPIDGQGLLGLGTALCRFMLLKDKHDHRRLIWDMHHSIYDGHSHVLLLQQLEALAQQCRRGESVCKINDAGEPPNGGFQRFIQYLIKTDQGAARGFWSTYLDGCRRPALSILRPAPKHAITTSRSTASIPLEFKTGTAFTTATYMRTAFALTLSQYAVSYDVNFAATINGRDLPVQDIEKVVGPTFATLPVRLTMDPNETIGTLLARTQKQSAECSAYQTLPIEEISKLNSGAKDACQFNTHLLVQSAPKDSPYEALKSLGYERLDDVAPMQLQIPLNVVATPMGDRVGLEVIYNDTAINGSDVELFVDQLVTILRQITLVDEESAIRDVFRLGEKNLQRISALQLGPGDKLPSATTIPDLIIRYVKATPEKEALFSSETSLTYSQLYHQACSFASQIQQSAPTPGRMVAFCFEKSVWAITAQLAIQLCGHSFVPIDPAWPESRRRSVLQQTQSPLLVTSAKLAPMLGGSDVEILALEPTTSASQEMATQTHGLRPSDVAYVLFTSGSTGEPKGVVVEHGSISRMLQAYAERLDFTRDTRALLFASFTFDASIMEAWSVLAAGGTLCIPDDTQRISDLSAFITESQADCIAVTPTTAGLLEPARLDHIKTLLFCGEKCRETDLENWRDREVVLVNAYGPTEASVNAATNTDFRDTALDDIGSSLCGGLWIVNPADVEQRLPVGCVGELLVSGPALAREYLNAPDKTAERFVFPTWLQQAADAADRRAFRTGDLARLDSKGRLHLLGRNDSQLKINGVRIEAEEIEDTIRQADKGTQQVVVDAFSHDTGDVTELAVYFVPGNTSSNTQDQLILPLARDFPDIMEAMRTAAQDKLPSACVPSLYIPVARIPFNVSGKVDRKHLTRATSLLHPSQLNLFRGEKSNTYQTDQGLQASQREAGPPTLRDKPLSPEQEQLQAMWASVLGSRQSHPLHANFWSSGGDSVAAIRLSAMAKSRGFDLPVNAIYANPCLEEMADAMIERKAKRAPTRPAARMARESVTTPAAFEMLQDIDLASPVDVFSPMSDQRVGASPIKGGRGRDSYFGTLA